MSHLRKDLGHLTKASYMNQKEAAEYLKKHGYTHDSQLSKNHSKVFVDKDGNPVVLHRGTHTFKDVLDDGLVALGLGRFGFRHKDAVRTTQKAEEKYQKAAHAVGHSYGGKLAEESGAHGKILTYNKAVGLGDLYTKKNSERQHDVRTKGDLVSLLGKTQNHNVEEIENKHLFPNALNAHNTDNLFGERQ